MTEKEIAEWLARTYEKAKREGLPSHKYDLSRSNSTTGTISIMTDGKMHRITKQALADNLNDDDNMASAIWNWIHP